MSKISKFVKVRYINVIALVAVLLCLIFRAIPCQADEKCEFKENHFIKVDTWSEKGSSVKGFTGLACMTGTDIPTLLSIIFSLLDNNCWLYECRKSEAIGEGADKRKGGQLHIVYHTDIGDRDVILDYGVEERQDKSVSIGLNSGRNSTFGAKEGLTRVEKAKGHWKFTPKKNGAIEVEYRLHMDPKLPFDWFPGSGRVMTWLGNVNSKIVPQTAYCTLKNLGKELEKKNPGEHIAELAKCGR